MSEEKSFSLRTDMPVQQKLYLFWMKLFKFIRNSLSKTNPFIFTLFVVLILVLLIIYIFTNTGVITLPLNVLQSFDDFNDQYDLGESPSTHLFASREN